MKSKLAIAVTLWGWLLFVVWLSYDYAEYQNRWIIHIFQPAYSYEIHAFHILIFLIPFIYTLLGYLVHEREKLLIKVKESEKNIVNYHFLMNLRVYTTGEALIFWQNNN